MIFHWLDAAFNFSDDTSCEGSVKGDQETWWWLRPPTVGLAACETPPGLVKNPSRSPSQGRSSTPRRWTWITSMHLPTSFRQTRMSASCCGGSIIASDYSTKRSMSWSLRQFSWWSSLWLHTEAARSTSGLRGCRGQSRVSCGSYESCREYRQAAPVKSRTLSHPLVPAQFPPSSCCLSTTFHLHRNPPRCLIRFQKLPRNENWTHPSRFLLSPCSTTHSQLTSKAFHQSRLQFGHNTPLRSNKHTSSKSLTTKITTAVSSSESHELHNSQPLCRHKSVYFRHSASFSTTVSFSDIVANTPIPRRHLTMTDTPSSSLDQSQQIEGKVPISPSHISDEISTPEPVGLHDQDKFGTSWLSLLLA